MSVRLEPTRLSSDLCVEVVYDPDGTSVDLSSRLVSSRPFTAEKDIRLKQYRAHDVDLVFIDTDGAFLQSNPSSFLVDGSGAPNWYGKEVRVRALDRDGNLLVEIKQFVIGASGGRATGGLRLGNRFQQMFARQFMANDSGVRTNTTGDKWLPGEAPIGTAYLDGVTPQPGCNIETWTFTFISSSNFTVVGSVTGDDGTGNIAADFTSDSGRIVAPTANWGGGLYAQGDKVSVKTVYRFIATTTIAAYVEALTSPFGAQLLLADVDAGVFALTGTYNDRTMTNGYVIDNPTTVLDVINNICLHMAAVAIEKASGTIGLSVYTPRLSPSVTETLCKDDDLVAARIDHTPIYNEFTASYEYDEAAGDFNRNARYPASDAENPSLIKYGKLFPSPDLNLRGFRDTDETWVVALLSQNYVRFSDPREIVEARLKFSRMNIEIDQLYRIESDSPTVTFIVEPAVINRDVLRGEVRAELFEAGFFVQTVGSCGFAFVDVGHRTDDCWVTYF